MSFFRMILAAILNRIVAQLKFDEEFSSNRKLEIIQVANYPPECNNFADKDNIM